MKYISLLGLTLLAFCSLAQSNQPLTLEEAIHTARSHRSDYLSAGYDVDAAQQAVKEQRSNYLPKVTANVDTRYNAILATSIVPNFAKPGSGETQAVKFGQPWQTTAGLTITQPLFTPTLKPTITTRQLDWQKANQAQTQAEADLIESVSTNYYRVLVNEMAVTYQLAALKRQESLYDQLQKRLAEGRALRSDVLSAEINVKNATLDWRQAKQDLKLSRYFLLLQMGVDTMGSAGLKLVNDLETQPLSIAAIDSGAYRQRTEWRNRQLDILRFTSEERRERKSILPSVNLVGYYGNLGFSKDLGGLGNFGQNWYSTSYIGIQLSSPLVDFSRANRMESQRLNRLKAQEQQRQVRRQVSYEITEASLRYEQGLERLSVKKDNRVLAEQSLQLVLARLGEGRALLTEVREAERELSQAEQQVLQSYFDVFIARLAHQKAIGQLATKKE